MYPRTIEELFRVSLKDLNKALRRKGLSLGKLDSDPEDSGTTFLCYWNCKGEEDYLKRGRKEALRAEISVRKDTEGLYLKVKVGDSSGDRLRLVRRESNLKPGTYRYYIVDPYSPDKLCEKIYYLPGVGEFVSREILSSYKILYRQQRRGHKDRYFFPPEFPKDRGLLRYRKKHYRGRITPFWKRYTEYLEEERYRQVEYLIGNGYGAGIFPPGLVMEVLEDYCKHTGRKTFPKGV